MGWWRKTTAAPPATDAAEERARQEALLAAAKRETARVKRRAPELADLPADELAARLRLAMTRRPA